MCRPRLTPILLSAAFLCAFGQAMAAETRHMDADGSDCVDSTPVSASTEVLPDEEPRPASAASRSAKPVAKPASANPRANTGGRSAPPRWHSFLPGMFR